jgi:chemotaxis protein methyltransferase CheR
MLAELRTPSDKEFIQFQKMVEQVMGVYLPMHKKPLLNNRLSKRLAARQCRSFGEYFELIQREGEQAEHQLALELLTTNETYFFREPKHFDFLRDMVRQKGSSPTVLRVWSAASSTGEEPYSIAMVLREYCRCPWEVVASDINTQVLEQARRAIYPAMRIKLIPEELKRKYCRKGTGKFQGQLRVVPELRTQVRFMRVNLNEPLPQELGRFDVIFIRNAMIYFERHTQMAVLDRLRRMLNSGGYIFIGHAESLQGLSDQFDMVQPAIYRLKSTGSG